MVRFRRSVRRGAGGTVELRIGSQERELLRVLATDVRGLVAGQQDADDRLVRLFPPTYGDDAAREAEFHTMFGDELRSSHLAALDALCETAGESTLDPEQALAWMQAVNSVRLVLGTHLDVDETPRRVSPRDPQAPLYAAYEYLGELLWQLTEALSPG